jgi:hypothetical protein
VTGEGETGESRERRVARNEVFFRETNELVRREAAQRGVQADHFICECSSAGCVARITISPGEYSHVRDRRDWFIVTPGHEDLTVEVVVEEHPEFFVVQKTGTAGAIARASAPR